VFEEHREEGDSRRGAAGVSTTGAGFSGGSGRAADPGVAAGLSDDAGHGDRGTDWVAVFDPHLEWAGGGAAAGLCAPGSGVAHQLSGWGDRPMRFLVPADQAAGRVWADAHRNPAAGADHDHRLCPLGVRVVGADAPRRGLVCRLVAADAAAGCGAAGVGVGRRGCGRPAGGLGNQS
jgi:hypothetical protein